MKKPMAAGLVLALGVAGSVAFAQNFRRVTAFLNGYEEVPAVSTTGSGEFTARISRDESQVDWTLSYQDLEGAVQQAHIHFGQPDVNGGISVFLCTNLGNGPAGTQACPPPPAEISGSFTAEDVIGPAVQGIAAGELDELIAAIRAERTYANVHSTRNPGGEIRGLIDAGGSGRRGHDGQH